MAWKYMSVLVHIWLLSSPIPGRASPDDVKTGLSQILAMVEKTKSGINNTKKAIKWVKDFNDGKHEGISKTLDKISTILPLLLNGLGFAGTVISMALKFVSFFLKPGDSGPSEHEQVMKELTDIQNAISDLSDQLKDVTTEIKSNVAYHNWLTTYITWELDIRNCDDRLTTVMADMVKTTDSGELTRLLEEYVTYYEQHNTEDAIKNIHALTGKPSTLTTRNLFELFVEEVGYHPRALGELMLVLTELVTSAATQTMTYYAFKVGMERAEQSYTDIQLLLDDIRIQFEWNIWHIRRDVSRHAMDEITSFIDDHPAIDATDDLVLAIHKHLSSLYMWFNWAVVVKSKNNLRTNGEFESKGYDYLYIPNYGDRKFNILAVWQGKSTTEMRCTDSIRGASVVFWDQDTPGQPDVIASDSEMMTSTSCSPYLQSVEKYFKKGTTFYRMPQWIGTPHYSPSTECDAHEPCSGHGSCLAVPHTSDKMCICYPRYMGDDCEVENGVSESIQRLLVLLRGSFDEIMQVPGVVDTYLLLREVTDQMENNHGQSVDYLASMISNADVFNKHHYAKYINGQLDEDSFGLQMKSLMTTESIDYLLSHLTTSLLGIGFFDEQTGDIVTNYKKSYIIEHGATAACTLPYATAVAKMIYRLAGLDEVVTEAALWYLQWDLGRNPTQDKTIVMAAAEMYYNDAKERQKRYIDTWGNHSCPTLEEEDIVENHCTSMLSYEGMNVQLSCKSLKVPYPTNVSCVKTNNTLSWSAAPKCLHVWRSWNSWASSCSKICGGGQTTRTRTKTDGQNGTETKACNTQDCCQSRYGKFKCSDGRCINSTQLCDGRQDCPRNGEDEKTNCNFINNGDDVALKSSCNKKYLGCRCSRTCSRGDWWKRRTRRSCEFESRYNSMCRFKIYKIGGGQIKHGDTVSLKFVPDNRWFSCSGKSGEACETENCPGTHVRKCGYEKFKILSVERKGSCTTSSTSSCIGMPIQYHNVINLWTRKPNIWVGGRSVTVSSKSCSGTSLDAGDATKCSCEYWTIYKKP